MVAAQLSQCCKLPLGLHPLGSHAQTQALGHGDDGFDNCGIVCVAFYIPDEGAASTWYA